VKWPPKYLDKLSAITFNSGWQMLSSLANLITSVLVIRFFSTDWWGEIVILQLIQYITFPVCTWGNKEYLLREFSKYPGNIERLWKQSFATRSVLLLLPLLVVMCSDLSVISGIHLFLWILFRFIQQAFDSVITFDKKFFWGFWVEIVALGFNCLALLLGLQVLTFNAILLILTVSHGIRAFGSAWLFRKLIFGDAKWQLSYKMIKESFSFMLLGFTGLLQTKIDTVVLSILLTKEQLAFYQVFTSFLLLIRSVSSFIIYPFLKNIYRFTKQKIYQVSNQLLSIGSAISVLGLLLLYPLMIHMYHFETPAINYVLGLLLCIPGFWFGPIVFLLFKKDKQHLVFWNNMVGIVINVVLCVLFIPVIGITGALLSSMAAQVTMAGVYMYYASRIIN
jgi:O-antigen/teichoic acid export membrane protein